MVEILAPSTNLGTEINTQRSGKEYDHGGKEWGILLW